MIERWARGFTVRFLAFAMARTDRPLRPALDRAFAHRDEAWRQDVLKDARKRMVSRLSRPEVTPRCPDPYCDGEAGHPGMHFQWQVDD